MTRGPVPLPERPRVWPGLVTLAVGVMLAIVPSAATRAAAGVSASPGPAARVGSDHEAVLVHIAGIHLVGPEQVMLLLADASEERALPISVGRDQGMAIYMGKEKTSTPRPMTHDLLVNVLRTLGVEVEKVTVTTLRKDTYFAEIALRADGRRHALDARPSDAIALAVRMGVPIFSSPVLLRPVESLGRPEATTRAHRELGLSIQEIDPDLAEFLGAADVQGVLVASVADGGPAASAGLRRGDIILKVDGRTIGSLADFRDATDGRLPREISIWREGRPQAVGPMRSDRPSKP